MTAATAARKIARLIDAYRERDPLAADALAALARQDFTADQWAALATFAATMLRARQ